MNPSPLGALIGQTRRAAPIEHHVDVSLAPLPSPRSSTTPEPQCERRPCHPHALCRSPPPLPAACTSPTVGAGALPGPSVAMSSACLRIGIDCGGTNTDAAVLDQDDRVLGWAKAVTTEDVLGGVAAAVRGALASARRGAHPLHPPAGICSCFANNKRKWVMSVCSNRLPAPA